MQKWENVLIVIVTKTFDECEIDDIWEDLDAKEGRKRYAAMENKQ
jgi:hypothetical protein